MNPLMKSVLRPGTFVRHVLTLITGNVMAQLVLVGAIPVVARLYRPSEIGIQALFFGFVAMLSIIAAWRYPLAIVQTVSDTEAVAVMKLSLALIMATTGTVSALAVLAGPSLLRWAERPELIPYLWCVPVALMLVSFNQVFSLWTIRQKHFRLQSVARVGASGATVAVQILLGWRVHASAGNLILGLVMGHVATTLVYVVHGWRNDRHLFLAPLAPGEVRRVFFRYRQFPMYSMPGNLLNEAVSDVPTFLITGYFGTAITGFFSMARKALGMPVTLISDAVSQVAHQRIAAARNAGQPGFVIVVKVFSFLVVLIAIPMLILTLWAPTLFVWIMGPGWAESGRFARALVPMYAMKFAVQPITRAFLVYERQLGGLLWQGSYFLAAIACLVAGHWVFGDPVAVVWCYSLAAGLMYLIILALNIHWAGGKLLDLPKRFLFVAGTIRERARQFASKCSKTRL